MSKAILTGSSGFIGSYWIKTASAGFEFQCESLQSKEPKEIKFDGIDAVVHLAGIAHRMEKTDPNIYYQINRDLTLKLALEAKSQGVRHFIFMSTVKVYGVNALSQPLSESSNCNPSDPYGDSKLQAEIALQELEDDSFTISIIRTPVVYGPGVKGNILSLMKLISKFKYLPFGNISNSRSMIFIGNLTTYIEKILDAKRGGIFIPLDERSVSTTDLVKSLSRPMNRTVILFSIPSFMRWGLKLVSRNHYDRLFGSLSFDNRDTNSQLAFLPPHKGEKGINEMVNWFNSIK